jgi:ribosomal protein S18 acetylase RimI-like enzyme
LSPQLGEMGIREAQPQDAASIALVHLAAWQIGYRGLLPDSTLANLSLEGREEMWRQSLIERQHPQLLRRIDVATASATVVGFVASGTSPPHNSRERAGEIYAIYVHPHYWSRGIGQALLHAATERLRRLGMTDGFLWMVRGNERARRFFELAGWRVDGQSRIAEMVGLADVDVPMNEVRFHKSL